jgi:hypothetical protein
MAMTFSNEQKELNYLYLLETIEEIEKNLVNDEWMDDQMDRIKMYRFWIENFAMMDPDNRDPEFRTRATQAELCMEQLIEQMIQTSDFEVGTYLIFVKTLKYLSEYYTPKNEVDSLLDMFNNIKITKNSNEMNVDIE